MQYSDVLESSTSNSAWQHMAVLHNSTCKLYSRLYMGGSTRAGTRKEEGAVVWLYNVWR